MQSKSSVRLLATSLLAAAIPCLALGAEPEDDEDQELEAVVVLGSHIPTIQKEGPSPTTKMTFDDMQKRGFTTADEAISSLTQMTGVTQNESYVGGFTQNASAIELRDLGPGHTLVLVDGHREAEYPLPYNGESNFVNLSAIPVAAIDYIELLSSGASAIYGSDAVAGVVNVVLKKKLEQPFSLDVRYGDTSQGGGQSTRVQLVTGFESGRLNTLFAAEFFDRKPIYAFERGFQDSVLDNPNPDYRDMPRAILRYDWGYDTYWDPGATACDAFPNLPYSARAGWGPGGGDGYYCGQANGFAEYTLRNGRQRGSLFGRATYALENAEIYGSLSLYASNDRYDPSFSWFSSDWLIPEGIFFDVSDDPNGDGGVYGIMQRYFQPYETGGYKPRQFQDHETVASYSAGVRGDLSGDWRYDLALAGSHYKYRETAAQLLVGPLYDYYLGEQLTDSSGNPRYDDPYGLGVPVYDIDWDKLYMPVSPEVYQSFLGENTTRAVSDSKTATLVLNGSLLTLPSGPLAAAVVLEAARQRYDIILDPQLLGGAFAGFTSTGGGGQRKRYAAGVELRVPVLDDLSLQLAGRHDRYDDITDVKGAFTYNVGLEYRPIRQLLLRGSHATSFRAPDMHYVFADPSGYYSDPVVDQYLCRRDEPGVAFPDCTVSSGAFGIAGTRRGVPTLKEETGKSFTFGFVAQPVRDLTITADYYSIRLKNAVQDYSIRKLLQNEADCRLGATTDGTPVDINSDLCQFTLAQITRDAFSEDLVSVNTDPINQAATKTTGIDASLGYGLMAGRFGRFDFTANYSTVLTYKVKEFAGDAAQDELDSMEYFGWHSRMSGSVTWTLGDISTTAFVQRFGSTPNSAPPPLGAATGRLGPWTTVNLSGRYSGLFGGEAYVGFVVDNLFDRKPPRTKAWYSYPYYSDYNYDPVGREYFLEIGMHF